MTLRRHILLGAAALSLASLAQAQSQGIKDNEIVLGTHLDLSGPVAAGMPMLRNAMQMRIDEVNAAGGVLGRPVELVVEDNRDAAATLGELLQLSGHDVELSYDGRSGLAKATGAPPDLMLIDMNLPDTNGLALLKCLRAEPALRGLRCVALSANAMPEDVRHARAAGFDDYWTKPIDVPRMLRALDALLAPPAR